MTDLYIILLSKNLNEFVGNSVYDINAVVLDLKETRPPQENEYLYNNNLTPPGQTYYVGEDGSKFD